MQGLDETPVHWRQLGGLRTALVVLLPLEAVASLVSVVVTGMLLWCSLLFLACVVVFLVWLYRARQNVRGSGYPQRRAPGWAIGAWFVPVVALWFPYQVVADIRRADPAARGNVAVTRLLGVWWTCWVLAWATSAHFTHNVGYGPDGVVSDSYFVTVNPVGTGLSNVITAAAAVLLMFIVRDITRAQEAAARAR